MSTVDEENRKMYERSKMAGAPIGLHIVRRRLSNEQLLKYVRVIEEVLKA